mmetsp:Transcript_26700/g.70120  ORF Transcript_26700/g.70120 Transcript_26700/m.70120 type:complete len:238 (+) Transcript_26700:938-1651(+)
MNMQTRCELKSFAAFTCDPVLTSCCIAPDDVFQKQMRRSAVPPPEASSCAWCGDHASALTAAWWCVMRWRGACDAPWLPSAEARSQMHSRLSLPPDASCEPEGDQRSPQISCVWAPCSWLTRFWAARESWLAMVLSREPLERRPPLFHAREPTRIWWPPSERICRSAVGSQSWTSAWCVPTASREPSGDQDTEVMWSPSRVVSQSCSMAPVAAFHRYTVVPSATARTLLDDQSSRLR